MVGLISQCSRGWGFHSEGEVGGGGGGLHSGMIQNTSACVCGCGCRLFTWVKIAVFCTLSRRGLLPALRMSLLLWWWLLLLVWHVGFVYSLYICWVGVVFLLFVEFVCSQNGRILSFSYFGLDQQVQQVREEQFGRSVSVDRFGGDKLFFLNDA